MNAAELDELIRRRERDIIYLKRARVDVKDQTLFDLAQGLEIDQYCHVENLYDDKFSTSATEETMKDLLKLFESLNNAGYLRHYEFVVYYRNGSNLCTHNIDDVREADFVKFVGHPSDTFMEAYTKKFADNMENYFRENPSNI